jgi:hypothetical protein
MTTPSRCSVSDLVLDTAQQWVSATHAPELRRGPRLMAPTRAMQRRSSKAQLQGRGGGHEMTCFRKLLRRTMGPVLAVGSWQARHHSTAQQSSAVQCMHGMCFLGCISRARCFMPCTKYHMPCHSYFHLCSMAWDPPRRGKGSVVHCMEISSFSKQGGRSFVFGGS